MSADESDNDAEDCVIFGTPLDPLREDEVPRKKPVPIEEQVVTDESGRRRFHGAFTGGFSAGYFNSVGSKEGWKPQQFVSSRVDKRDKFVQRAEDFMDDEDISSFGISPQTLRASSKFQHQAEVEGDRKRKLVASEEPLLVHALLSNIFKPPKQTIGVTLLTKMGWRPGQGIGPKLTRKQKTRRKEAHQRIFGPSTSNRDSSDESDDDQFYQKYRDFLFAPDDLPVYVISPKENQQGIGYKGLERSNVFGSLSSTGGHFNLFDIPEKQAGKGGAKGRLKISGQAFGVGAFEEDDEDIYARDDMANYDFSLDDEQDEKRKGRRSTSRWSGGGDQPGRDCIDGFEIDFDEESSKSIRSFFPPPEIPKNWQPKFLSRMSRFEPEKPRAPQNLTPSERRDLVETQPRSSEAPKPAMSEDQLKTFLSANMKPVTADQMKPFSSNPDKQSRYEKYLVCVKNNRADALPLLQPKSMTDWERDRERVEFERAALLYQPLATSMSSRFVSAGTTEEADRADRAGEEKISEAMKAVKMKMFGALTREKVEWHPARLLCIRFNVKNPYSDNDVIGVPSSHKSKFDIFGRLEKTQTKPATREDEVTVDQSEAPEAVSLSSVLEVEAKNDASGEEEITKPPIDLFKSIFLDSGSSSESEDEQTPTPDATTRPAEDSLSRADSVIKKPLVATGLFANVDFDRLNARGNSFKKVEKMREESVEKTSKALARSKDAEKCVEKSDDETTFGPAKPVTALQVSYRTTNDTSSSSESSDSSDVWMEKASASSSSTRKKKKKKKEKKKKKSSKHKKEKKKRKKKRKKSDSDD